MNALRSKRVFMRSMATRRQHMATNIVLKDCIAFLKSLGYDMVIVETAGIGQSDSEIVDLVDFPMYVMTSDFGAPSQLEKIDMLDYAELVVLNKFDKRGAEDALRDVRKQWKRNRVAFNVKDEDIPVYPTIASQFNDPGISWMFANLTRLLRDKLQLPADKWTPDIDTTLKEPRATVLIPGARVRYLAEIAEQGRGITSASKHRAKSPTAPRATGNPCATSTTRRCRKPSTSIRPTPSCPRRRASRPTEPTAPSSPCASVTRTRSIPSTAKP
jgi:methylmalonyl-CoA mutase